MKISSNYLPNLDEIFVVHGIRGRLGFVLDCTGPVLTCLGPFLGLSWDGGGRDWYIDNRSPTKLLRNFDISKTICN